MSSPCTTPFTCYLLTIKKSAELQAKIEGERTMEVAATELASGSQSTADDSADFGSDLSNFRVLFPVILVASMLVVISLGFLLYRLVSSVAWTNWTLSGESTEDHCPRSPRRRNFHRRRWGETVSTVSSNVDVPPTYKQVMKSKKAEIQPPTYKEVMTGTVNCGFVSDEDIVNMLHKTDQKSAKKTNVDSFANHRTQPKRIDDEFDIVVHTADIFSLPRRPNVLLRDLQRGASVPPNESLGGNSSSSNYIITVADVNVSHAGSTEDCPDVPDGADDGEETTSSAV